MSNPRELMARLNPQTIKYDIGRGGVSELSNQDIAAALAFVPAGLGREVLEACWWPDGAALRRHSLRDAVYSLVRTELERQTALLSDARTHRGMIYACANWSSSTTPELRQEMQVADARLESVKIRCWPAAAWEMLPVIVQAVVNEIAHPNQCHVCGGRGQRMAEELVVTCASCSGRGTLPISDRKRAEAIGRDESTYRAKWRPMYEWLMRAILDAEQEAARSLSDALKDAA